MSEPSTTLIEVIASQVGRRRLEMPVVMALETLRPLAGCLGLLGEAFVPIISVFLGISQNQLQIILQDESFLPRLIERLEEQNLKGAQFGS